MMSFLLTSTVVFFRRGPSIDEGSVNSAKTIVVTHVAHMNKEKGLQSQFHG